NGSDLVPRIPPSHAHCGSLVWFTDGGVRRSRSDRPVVGAAGPDEAPTSGDEVLVPLSERQFEELQAGLREESSEPERLPDGTPIMKSRSRLIDDHAMSLYLERVRSHIGTPTEAESVPDGPG
ncbi:MAG TPA: hypothetical protein VF170_06995, partial [Planctomycetaceae bacterium]